MGVQGGHPTGTHHAITLPQPYQLPMKHARFITAHAGIAVVIDCKYALTAFYLLCMRYLLYLLSFFFRWTPSSNQAMNQTHMPAQQLLVSGKRNQSLTD